jgi:serine/threonine protein kinase
MGAVYRATDTKLNRQVAIKVLPEPFADDTDRMRRFEREAQVLASLNHSNIAAIYGVEERAVVMELVEGAELRGPIAEEQSLPIMHQLIDALEYAHEKGIVHRDLKPANIKVTPDGRVKVLDFGLAKAISGDPVQAPLAANSPSVTMRATRVGVILGTAAYMSPEQARGGVAPTRSVSSSWVHECGFKPGRTSPLSDLGNARRGKHRAPDDSVKSWCNRS